MKERGGGGGVILGKKSEEGWGTRYDPGVPSRREHPLPTEDGCQPHLLVRESKTDPPSPSCRLSWEPPVAGVLPQQSRLCQ